MNIVEVASRNPIFSTLVSVAKSAGVTDTLSGEGPFTVFAPSNDAFAKLREGALDDLKKPENKVKLAALLNRHVIGGKHMAAEFANQEVSYGTLGGPKITVSGKGGKLNINAVEVTSSDIEASNGVIHSIDILLPPAR